MNWSVGDEVVRRQVFWPHLLEICLNIISTLVLERWPQAVESPTLCHPQRYDVFEMAVGCSKIQRRGYVFWNKWSHRKKHSSFGSARTGHLTKIDFACVARAIFVVFRGLRSKAIVFLLLCRMYILHVRRFGKTPCSWKAQKPIFKTKCCCPPDGCAIVQEFHSDCVRPHLKNLGELRPGIAWQVPCYAIGNSSWTTCPKFISGALL